MTLRPTLQRGLLLLVKLGLSGALLTYLFRRVVEDDPETFVRLLHGPVDLGLLPVAQACFLLALLVGFARWRLLVRAAGIPLRMGTAVRVGALAYLVDFFALGVVGGDIFKAVWLARENAGARARAVVSVVVDRAIGLFALMCVASFAFLLVAGRVEPGPELRWIGRAAVASTLAGAAGLALLFHPGFARGPLARAARRIPLVGPAFHSLLTALRVYRNRPGALGRAFGLSLAVQTLIATGFYVIGTALPPEAPAWVDHLLIIPLAMVAGMVPLPFEALGVLDLALGFLYLEAGAGTSAAALGLFVAMAYRLTVLVNALLGVGFYLGHRREVADALEEAVEAATRAPFGPARGRAGRRGR